MILISFSKYYEAVYILFKTGMRISEFCGLTIDDIDLKAKAVRIERQLMRTSDMKLVIEHPKTQAGDRVIPISDEVCDCFKAIIESRPRLKKEPTVSGIKGFLYLDKNGIPTTDS